MDQYEISLLKGTNLVYDLCSYLHEEKRIALNVLPQDQEKDKFSTVLKYDEGNSGAVAQCGTEFVLAAKVEKAKGLPKASLTKLQRCIVKN